jgi:hypothetical protein
MKTLSLIIKSTVCYSKAAAVAVRLVVREMTPCSWHLAKASLKSKLNVVILSCDPEAQNKSPN